MILGCGWKRLRSVAGRQEVTYRYRQPGTCTTNILNFPSASNKTTIPSYHVSLSTTNSPKMPAYIVTLHDDATDEQIAAAKKKATEAGGKITQEYSLIKGFAVSYPEGTVSTLAEDPSVKAVEEDAVMTTQ
ncbi:hypothetical protein M441DRAFT_55843 [Trichoderma asperellum CBS 433.97]|uniref:Inhibitor I9 domain-containing protein n=2 Tax=Trichoderma asperellum TaxID=101201 RepID=A0A2T3ZD99_TRIA4|nr:hypothetical protein M441DRAFT_55843 [Trichoderma asperellum CBS 433.97]PTB42783.1 hypothetical protein M441DRAFT_55843 [Trichoderma asperellum CBS 433.97]